MVHYNNNNGREVISDFTTTDAGQHWLIMKSLAQVIRMAVLTNTPQDDDGAHIATVAELLSAMIPDEYQLEHGISYSEKMEQRSKSIKRTSQQQKFTDD